MSEHDGIHIMPMYYRMSTHAIPIRDGQTDIGVPIQDIIIQAMGDRDAKLASARAENERLRIALQPFADAATFVADCPDTISIVCGISRTITFGDLRRADAALAKNP